MQSQGGGLNNMQKLQEMQRLQHQMAQLQRQQQAQGGGGGSRSNSQTQAMLAGSAAGMSGLANMNFGNASSQWGSGGMDVNAMSASLAQRNSLQSLATNNQMLMAQQQQPSMGGMANQSWLYGNGLGGAGKGNGTGLGSMSDLSGMGGSKNGGLGGSAGVGGGGGFGGLMDQNQQMQALLTQQQMLGNVGATTQAQMSRMGQNQLSSNDLGGALGGMGGGFSGGGMMGTTQQQMQLQQQLQRMGSSSSIMNGSGNSPMQNSNLLMQQNQMMDTLKRQLASGGSSDSRRSSAVNMGGMNTQLLQMQQQQQRGSSSMLSMSGMLGGDSSNSGQSQRNSLLQRQMSASGNLQNDQQQRKHSLGSTEPISIASLMGDNSAGSGGSSSSRAGSSSGSLMGIFDSNSLSNTPSPSSQMDILMAQQAQLGQMAKKSGGGLSGMGGMDVLQQQQQLIGGGNSGGMTEMQKQMLGMTSTNSNQTSRSSSLQGGSGGTNDLLTGDLLADSFNEGAASSSASRKDKSSSSSNDMGSSSGTSSSRRRSSSRSSMKKSSSEVTSSGDGQSFLGGTFAGGWQSNKDIPDRRTVIYSICKVIEEMRPDASKMSQKLPFMAKRLEEHLYRSAQTKEEYLNPATLKKRLQMIAHGLEMNRPDKSESKSSRSSSTSKSGDSGSQVEMMKKLQQLQELQKQQQQNNSSLGGTGMDTMSGSWQQQKDGDELLREQAKRLSQGQAGLTGMAGGLDTATLLGNAHSQQLQENMLQQSSSSRSGRGSSDPTSTSGILKGSTSSKYGQAYGQQQDPQKKKVIKQQQQRLLLLRHASKCKSGSACKVKFCGQMVQLWKHMKKCRDKHCKTAHCLSSRCVLNHYRICKSENKTASCEVCGPVTKQIKQQNSSNNSGMDSSLGKTEKPSSRGSQSKNQMQARTEDLLKQQKQRQSLQIDPQKLAQQEMLMKQLQQQQAQLVEQQKAIQQQKIFVQPHSPQDQQLQQRQMLLQQLQQQFASQQLALQQELVRQQQVLTNAAQMGMSSSMNPLSDQSSMRRPSSSQQNKNSLLDSLQQGVVARGGGKGKRLSALEGRISNPDPLTVKSSGSKRNANTMETTSSSMDAIRSSKAIKTDTTQSGDQADSSAKNEPEETKSMHSGRVLQQGDSDQNTSLIASMDASSIDKHLKSLNEGIQLTSRTITQKCLPVVQTLLDDQFGWVFRDAVDPDILGLPDYFEVVKNPMHLSLIVQKLENGVYNDLESFERDTKLVFENAILYNGEESEVGDMAKAMLRLLDREHRKVLEGIKGGQEWLMKIGDICSLCATQRRLFEPTVLYCSGSCGMSKIRRNTYYYTDPSKTNSWCVPCFTALKDDEAVILDDGSNVSKYHLQKLKNDATPEEAWVQCDTCESWVHQICALFNGRKNKSAASYSCPKCHLKKVATGQTKKPEESLKGAGELPHCKLSKALEEGLERNLLKAYEQRALEKGIPVGEVEKAKGLSVRVISNMEQKHVVRDEMYERYSKAGCPQEFPVRSKCIALFQSIHGVDVMLFAMYVFEYSHDCPAPNRRRVYISYLDSVNYFHPKEYRTGVYHAIIVEYLRYVKERGFHTAHIWSCPPSPGDDYIFHCHPSKQLIPKDDMLRQWYHDMLEKAKADGIVLEVRSLYDEFFKNNGADAICGNASDPTCLPYFEGDYIPGELENIIKDVKADEEAKRRTNPNWEEERPTSSNNRTGKKTGTRSNPGALVSVGQDKVMLRLGLAVSNMKQNFFVVQLRSREFAAAVERGDDVSEWKEEDDGSLASAKRPKIGGKGDAGGLLSKMAAQLEKVPEDSSKMSSTEGLLTKKDDVLGDKADTSAKTDSSSVSKPADDDCSLGTVSVSLGQNHDNDDPFGDSRTSLNDSGDVKTDDISSTSERKNGAEQHSKMHESDVTSKSVEASSLGSKRGFDEMGPAIARHFASMNAKKKPIGDTIDADGPQDLELFESRQQFLSYCQKNHFQFDELRRAKHTTMMVLFQLHNPTAPKFLHQCGACYKEISQGVRYHCNTCSNFDLCEECYEPVMKGEWAQRDKRFAHDPNHSFSRVKIEPSEKLDKKSTEERARTIKVHLELLSHAATCPGPPTCSLNNCQKMKQLFEHVKTCDVTPKKSCKICTRLLFLLTMHSRLCTVRGRCPLPFCDRIRERNRRRRRQQQLMDDRRRQAQNQLYRQTDS